MIGEKLQKNTKSRIPKHPIGVKLYLKFPIVWKIMGKQALVIAIKPSS
jgi:hypothetical protein